MGAYYNEHDKFAAAWLRELIKEKLIADGEVDERSIADVGADDLRGFVQCHFFAGIGGWSYALRLAGWPDDRPVWTGSCPCQPFSAAGKGDGASDPRHLWPAWFRLIAECRPPTIFGEQVASIDGLAWFDAVSTDLEGAEYAVASADLSAAGVGAPHIRQRLWFVADTEHTERRLFSRSGQDERGGQDTGREKAHSESGARRKICDMGDPESGNWQIPILQGRSHPDCPEPRGASGLGVVDDAESDRRQSMVTVHREHDGQKPDSGQRSSFWSNAIWIPCRDGKTRPIEPTIFPLASGIPNRVGLLRGAGNAIVPQVAAIFIQAYLDGA